MVIHVTELHVERVSANSTTLHRYIAMHTELILLLLDFWITEENSCVDVLHLSTTEKKEEKGPCVFTHFFPKLILIYIKISKNDVIK